MSLDKYFQPLGLKIKGVRLPEVIVPQEDYDRFGVEKGISNLEFLRVICRQGYKDKAAKGDIDKSRAKEYGERINYELDIIDKTSFTDYILLVWDVINFCHKNDIPIGEGRGSAAGSAVLFLSGVTGLDPINYGLFFERFISMARAKSTVIDGILYIDGSLAPDVDLDICYNNRARVVEYLAEKYKGKFCKLPTISTLQPKIVIKECGKIVGGFHEEDMNHISSLIPTQYGKAAPVGDIVEDEEKVGNFLNDNPRVLKIAQKLEGLIRNKSSHASAYLVSFDPLDDYMPMEMSVNGELTCSPDMHYAQMECIKLDLLGLQSVTLCDRVMKRVGLSKEDIDTEDYGSIYDHLQDLKYPYGLFQISGDCNFRVVKHIAPKTMSELSAVVALARPGALSYVSDYVKNKNSGSFDPVHEIFEEELAPTYGLPLYQEQAMAMGKKIGFSLDQAEMLRRVIGKKKVEEMPAWKEKVFTLCEKNGIEKEAGEVLWKVLDESANYSFNLSHSISYAYLSALTVYLKFNHTTDFYIEALEMAKNKQDETAEIRDISYEMREIGVPLLPPDLRHAKIDFSREGKDIRFGLGAIKGVAEKSWPNLMEFSKTESGNKFELFQAAKNAKLNIGILCSLIQAGCLQALGKDRPKMVYEAQVWNKLTDREKMYLIPRGEEYGYDVLSGVKDIHSWVTEKGKPFVRDGRLDRIKEACSKYREIYRANSKRPELASYYYEMKLLGYCYSGTLVNCFPGKRLQSIKTLKDMPQGKDFRTVGEVLDVVKRRSKNSDKNYLRIKIGDDTGSTDIMLFGDKCDEYLENNKEPKENDLLFVIGRTGDDVYWADRISVQETQVYLKLSDLK